MRRRVRWRWAGDEAAPGLWAGEVHTAWAGEVSTAWTWEAHTAWAGGVSARRRRPPSGFPAPIEPDPVLAFRRLLRRRAVVAGLLATAVLGGGFAGAFQPRPARPPAVRRQVGPRPAHRKASGPHHTAHGHAGRPVSDSLGWVLSASRD